MNSEELEQSLRMEFETYLKSVIAEMRLESEEFQNRIEAEFDRHKSQFNESFRSFAARFDSTPAFDDAFTGSVGEHLRLARDEGAKLAANAMVEAEKLDDKPAPAAKYDAIRDAVNDISSKDSQSAILKSLVHHAEGFAPRGAFFIIRNEHFAGWKVFGTNDHAERAIRDIHFPVEHDTILGTSIRDLSAVEGSAGQYSNDNAFLGPLSFDAPDQMMALPLVARGRGVAVLYVDRPDSDGEINREALETIVRVAGLTVELLASILTAQDENRAVAAVDLENARHEHEEPQQVLTAYEDSFGTPAQPIPVTPEESGFAFNESAPLNSQSTQFQAPSVDPAPEYKSAFQQDFEIPTDLGDRQQTAAPFAAEYEPAAAAQEYEAPAVTQEYQMPSMQNEPQAAAEPPNDFAFGTPEPAAEAVEQTQIESNAPQTGDFGNVSSDFGRPEPASSAFDSERAAEPAVVGSPFDRAVEEYKPAGGAAPAQFEAPEPAVPAPAASQARLSDRHVDLPIDVPEEERRLHNDARRFARLLVSEIKLYNEKKVVEGRQSHDLYERLREAIDRSREMYDKRVQPPVAAKFDYFHYEIMNSLADGNVERLGAGYPGAAV